MSLRILPSHRPDRSQHPLIVRLSSGFRRFQHRWYHPDEPLFKELKCGQKPQALVIACSDSRVDPALLTDSRPGDLFILRNVANLVHPYVPGGGALSQNAAIEYAVKHLKVQDIIVMGHACCGGIKALVSARARILAGEHLPEADEDEFIGPWVKVAVRALEQAEEGMGEASLADKSRACELWSVRLSLENLLTFPWVKEAVEEGRLALHGWYFDLQSGELLEFDQKEQAFRPLVGRPHAHDLESHGGHHHERRPRAEHWEAHGEALWAHYDSRSMEDSGSRRSRAAREHHPEHHREHLPRSPHGHVRGRHD
ncbi:MAG: carbonic anhydrase [Mailhella sp.]|nr:carbonic anhydrase [Mailhella sp.]